MITKKLEPITPDLIKVVKSIYDKPEKSDGVRILVTRLWPRGIKKEKVDTWMKDLGCERDLIKKWKAGSITFAKFRSSYITSLRKDPVKTDLLRELSDQVNRGRTVTLLCSCRDYRQCHRSFIKEQLVELL